MKNILALVGIMLISSPIFWIARVFEELHETSTKDELISSFYGTTAGLFIGFTGLMLLGFLCDGGKGFAPTWLFVALTIIGIIWIVAYPSGWLLGIPLVIYSGEKLISKMLSHEA